MHIERGHVPYRKDCRACVEGAGGTRPHRRVKHPEAATLSADIVRRFKPGKNKEKFMLVAACTLVKEEKKAKVKVPQPPGPYAPATGSKPFRKHDAHRRMRQQAMRHIGNTGLTDARDRGIAEVGQRSPPLGGRKLLTQILGNIFSCDQINFGSCRNFKSQR